MRQRRHALCRLEGFLRAHLHEGRLNVDGLFHTADSPAHRIHRSLIHVELRVPEDVKIIGCDGAPCFGDQEYFMK